MGQYRVWVGVCAMALLCGGSSAAQAQEAPSLLTTPILEDQATAVAPPPQTDEQALPRKRKPRPDLYAAQGIGQGPIHFFPVLEIGSTVTDNAAATPANRKTDIGLQIRPSLAFQSDWSRHAWRGSIAADWLGYANSSDTSTLAGTAQTDFRLDILHTTHADFAASFTANQTANGNPEVPGNALGPRRDQTFTTSAAITHDFGGLEAQFKTALNRSTFGDVALNGGATEFNSDRNYWQPSVSLRGTLGSFGAPLKPYVELGFDPRFHDQALDRNGQKRNSLGLILSLGAVLDDGPIWTGDVSANFIARSYDDPALKTAAALGLNGNITWSPTPLWTVVASTGVALGESEQVNVSATQTWNAGLQANYALRENLKLRAGLTGTLTSSPASTTSTTTASLGADWQLNPNMAISGTLQSTWFGSDIAAAAYDEQRATTSFILRR